MVDMELCVITCGTMRMQLLCVFKVAFLLTVRSSHFSPITPFLSFYYYHSSIISFVICAGAIPIDGGLFSDPSVPVLIGNVDCNGNESNLLDCSYITENDEVVSQCDPREKAAVACQGKCIEFEVPIYEVGI